ncbi:class II fumarate hydratase [Marinospirillum alkaliphilum]|uniref:Fumarate hydratase class II n=1 Tax=Marinospirillum alkaliphilum DSM 21637 TaxID=1122209 RepID=A0A1K1XGV8_9GAMM|nr:class II fumarate hydratase [Marinospirillum alkaliphilum]SFX48316.1 fumarase, class II [Marinospirillum alkaliphilum DSM 21637]
MNIRIEKDSLGELQVPADALYSAQTQRAINNFPISGQPLPEAFIRSLLLIKITAAHTNAELGLLSQEMADAIEAAADELLGNNSFMQHFPVDVFQTGSGTSSNMNANEVLATLASRILGQPVSANDHINCSQSSNDVIPTCIHVSAVLALQGNLLPALRHLQQACLNKADQVGHLVKTGRTHLMDAMPVTFGQMLEGWATQINHNIQRLETLQPQLQQLAQGGTAVGTGINAHPAFTTRFCQLLSEQTGLDFRPADHFFALIGSQDTAVALSGQLKTTAVSLMKIANDLRWMNSGPLAGLAEIELEALQPGSSIMPGKVNPVIPEAVAMVAAQVIGKDAAITVAGQSGNFELNVMLPLVAANLLESLQLLSNASHLLADRAITTFKVKESNLQKALDRNPILVTALNPLIGYAKAAEIAKQAYKEGRPILDVAAEQTDLSRTELEQLLNPEKLTRGGL